MVRIMRECNRAVGCGLFDRCFYGGETAKLKNVQDSRFLGGGGAATAYTLLLFGEKLGGAKHYILTCRAATAAVSTRNNACLPGFRPSNCFSTMLVTSVVPGPGGRHTRELRSHSMTERNSSVW